MDFPLNNSIISLESFYKFKFNEKPKVNEEVFLKNMQILKDDIRSQKCEYAKDKKHIKKSFNKKEMSVINESLIYKNISLNNQNPTMNKINSCH